MKGSSAALLFAIQSLKPVNKIMAPAGIVILLRNIDASKCKQTFDTVFAPAEIFPDSFAVAEKHTVSFLLFIRDEDAMQYAGSYVP